MSSQIITDKTIIEEIIRKSIVCRVAFCDDNQPYIIPMCFGYRNNVLYLHSNHTGKKIEYLQKNDLVGFEFDQDVEVVPAPNPCNWNMKYRSVTGSGRATMITDMLQKKNALQIIFHQYSGNMYGFSKKEINAVTIIKIAIIEMTGKVNSR